MISELVDGSACTKPPVDGDAEPVSGVAELVSPNAGHLAALRAKYGLEYRLVMVVERLLRRGRRDRVIVRITAG